MNIYDITRRRVLKAAAALAATGLSSCAPLAQRTSAGALPGRGEFVIRGAHVLTLDPAIGDFATGDVHVRDGAIAAVGPQLPAQATSIDGRGMICMPGFVDTHWHLWTSALRPVIRIDDPKLSYQPVTNRLGQLYTPEDSYRSVRLGVAEGLAAGATTIHNWAHNIRSPAHADAELRAMRDCGVRGRLAYGTPMGHPDDQPMDLAGLAKTRQQWMPNDGTLTLGICSRNVGDDTNPLRGNISVAIARQDWGGARALGLPITMHTSGPSPIRLLEETGLIGPDLQLVHPLLTTAEERQILRKRGVSYSTSPTGEARRSVKAGVIQLAELLEAGVKVSISIDHTSAYGCDYFQCMRILYALHLHRVGTKPRLTTKRLVQLATLDGAIDLGIADRTGSLTPGKRADLILVRTTDINIAPVSDPYEALVTFAQPRNVDTVVVDGRILRRASEFTALDHPQVVRDALATADGLRKRAGWP
jgi:5-methylthioadenosine/S-adenosylhomocysteine deaminase